MRLNNLHLLSILFLILLFPWHWKELAWGYLDLDLNLLPLIASPILFGLAEIRRTIEEGWRR